MDRLGFYHIPGIQLESRGTVVIKTPLESHSFGLTITQQKYLVGQIAKVFVLQECDNLNSIPRKEKNNSSDLHMSMHIDVQA